MITVKLETGVGAVTNEYHIIFGISGVEVSLWLVSDMSNKDFVLTLLNFLEKVIKSVNIR